MSQKYAKLKTLLQELFQLDQPDLDFGLYRIMHAKSAEVTQFLDRDLLPQVRLAFSQYQTADKADLEKELAKLVAAIESAGMNPEESPKVKDLRARLKQDSVDGDALETEVYDHLYSFFRRYYSEGDFLSKRVYKPGVYAIPYEGEEVKLHWANADQYYIKTNEYLRDYAFRLRPDNETKPMRVHFKLVDAAEGEHGNVKEVQGKERRFRLAETDAVSLESGELSIRFTYKPEVAKQKELNAAAEATLLAVTDPALTEWIRELGQLHRRTDGSDAGSRLRVHLDRYTARNTFDYFIHKDLGGFLRRELDFFIKNEVMHLDDVENESAPRVEQYLSKIKVIRKIAGKIIDFLAQLEDFQKALWLKKKFVVETSYCIQVGSIPEEFYPEIAANEAQIDEWVKLYAIDEIQGDLAGPGFTRPTTVEFLIKFPTLMVNLGLFDFAFGKIILSKIENLSEITDGVLIHSENFQALSLLQKKHQNNVNVVYIDPPYNTGGDGFAYRDRYKHSSWISMISDRLKLMRSLMDSDGLFYASIDANERSVLEQILGELFGIENRVEEVIWVQNATKNQSPTFSTNHEYVEVYAKNLDALKLDPMAFREPKPGYAEVREGIEKLNERFYTVAEIEKHLRAIFGANKKKAGTTDETTLDQEPSEDWGGLYNYNRAEYRDANGKLIPERIASEKAGKIWIWREDNPSMPQVKEDSQNPKFRDPTDPAFRFYRPIHPITGKPCPHPKTGWRWPFKPLGKQSNSFIQLVADDRIAWGVDESKIPQVKRFLHEVETNVAKSVVNDFTDGEKELVNLFGVSRAFSNPKPTTLPLRFIRHFPSIHSNALDFFGGSGTTGHAVINLNREDGGRRKMILVEAGDHFGTVLLPRLKKVTFTPEWKDGKPKRFATAEEAERSPRILKVIRLESYEDTLNNLDIRRGDSQQSLLDAPLAQGSDALKEQYLLRYMLDVETRGSQSLLNIQAFTDPTAYKLKVKRPGSDESREVNVDLLETFNWLIGLTVQHLAAPQAFSATFERDSEKRLRLKRSLKPDASGPFWFRTVTGTTPDGRNTLVIWRKLTGNVEEDNLVLDEWFHKQTYSSKDRLFDLIYVNGGNNLENLKTPEQAWKVRLLEEDFHRLMFAGEGA